MEENSSSYFAHAKASFYWSVMVVVQTLRLLKTVRQKCSHPAVLGVELESDEISTCPRQRKEQQNSDPYEPRHLKLQFSNNMIIGPVYTGRPIGEDLGNALYLDLIDCRTEKIVTYGAEASVKVEIFAVEKEEFKIATSWADEKSLIGGDPYVSLKDGRVCVSHISFKHSGVHMRKRELRLAARVVCRKDFGNRILEAVSEPFWVVDRRSMPKSKRSLNLDDQVWKLPTIGKGGPRHEFLTNKNIDTVRDFLTHYFLNREYLLNILGRRMNGKKLDAAVNQVKGQLGLKKYVYPGENLRVVFTDVGELIGVKLYEEDQFVSVEQLTQTQKASGMKLVKRAFQDGHQNLNVLLDDDSSQMICSSSSSYNSSDHLDGSSNGFTSEANNFPTDPQQLQPQPHNDANYMKSTRLGDYMSQINSSSTTLTGGLPHLLHPDEDDVINQLLNANWDL